MDMVEATVLGLVNVCRHPPIHAAFPPVHWEDRQGALHLGWIWVLRFPIFAHDIYH